MNDQTAAMGWQIGWITAIVLVATGGVFILAFFYKALFLFAAALTVINTWVYLCWTPVAYELKESRLTIFYRLGSRTFDKVRSCAKAEALPRFILKMWANGGLFAAAGLFWSKSLGLFYAYLTTTDARQILVLETNNQKIFISPCHPEKFINEGSGLPRAQQ